LAEEKHPKAGAGNGSGARQNALERDRYRLTHR
jgi:hypothetical protein